jgi:hypothetical protein
MVLKICFFTILLISNLLYGHELKTVIAEEFIAQDPSPERTAMVDFLIHQFDEKRAIGITQEQLNQVWYHPQAGADFHLARFQIINQKLYANSAGIYHPYFINLIKYFQKLVTIYKINDVDFIIYARDEIPPSVKDLKTLSIPAFMMFRNPDSPYEKDKFLLPDSNMLKDNWQSLIKKIELANQNYTWEKKLTTFFWRGASTGGEAQYLYNVTNFAKFPRLKLVMLSKLYPDLIDAKFFKPIFSKDKDGDNLQTILKLLNAEDKESTQEIDHLKYKYLLSIDGNSCTGTRVPWIMLSNSVLVKQDSNKIQWFYSAIKPYVHYIPIKSDLTNIFSQLDWIKNHDYEVQSISKNAHNFVKHNLMPEHIDAHVIITLNEYSKLQKDQKIIPSLPPAVEALSITSLLKNLTYELIRNFIIWMES